ncbi:hypothetical protein ACA30_13210 [Virgibacillus soli]|uniref:Uncharacterized protein n=1 Tax=Lederbergia galactosidilytica TaxID=217031 RepID=A0A0Q9YG90_9BACI|nr:hypothetical protein ACA30_13210 [Virgibacillus soli]KRG16850.1 hypothetical protein ACA29_02925 [Lederbergia galactosidilytica]
MIELLLALLHFIAGATGVLLVYGGDYIPPAKHILISGVVLTIVYYTTTFILQHRSKKAKRLVMFSITVYISVFLSSYLYSVWTFDKLFSAEVIMKVILFMLLLVSVYGNILYMRAETSYKKKRGNQRIQVPRKESLIEKYKNRNQEPEQEVILILGESTENE